MKSIAKILVVGCFITMMLEVMPVKECGFWIVALMAFASLWL